MKVALELCYMNSVTSKTQHEASYSIQNTLVTHEARQNNINISTLARNNTKCDALNLTRSETTCNYTLHLFQTSFSPSQLYLSLAL